MLPILLQKEKKIFNYKTWMWPEKKKRLIWNVYLDYLRIALIIFKKIYYKWSDIQPTYHLLFFLNGTFNHLHDTFKIFITVNILPLRGLNSYTMIHWDVKRSGLSRGRKGDQDQWLVIIRTKVSDLNIDMFYQQLCIHFNDFKIYKNVI